MPPFPASLRSLEPTALDLLPSELLLLLASAASRSETPALIPVVIGNYFSSLFFGIILVQATGYQRRHRMDSLWIKIPLYTIVALNVALSSINLSREIIDFGLHFGDMAYLLRIQGKIEDILIGFLSMIISASAQTFLLVRFLVFKRALRGGAMSTLAWASTITISFFIATSFVSGVTMQASFVSYADYDDFMEDNQIAVIGKKVSRYPLAHLIWLVSTVTTDLLICVSLSWGLHLAKTGNQKSRSFLQNIINISLRNGALLFGSQILVMILYFAARPEWTGVALLCTPQLATITLISSITSPREAARNQERKAGEDRQLQRKDDASINERDSDEKTPPIALKPFKTSRFLHLERVGPKSSSRMSLSTGVEVQMTSRIEVEENVALTEREGRLLGNSVLIEGPLTTPRRRSLPHRSLHMVDHFPSSQVNSIQIGTYDPEMEDEYELPYINLEGEP